MSRPNLRELKSRVSMLDILAKYAISIPRKNEHYYRGPCPLPSHTSHEKDTFAVNTQKQVWSCQSNSCAEARGERKREGHGAKKGGDIFDFVRAMEKCNIRRAGELVREWFGVSPAAPQVAPLEVVPPPADNPPLKFELKDGDYTHPYLVSRGFEEEECRYLDVAFHPGKGSMEGRIRFAIHNERGELVGYAGRLVDDSRISEENPRWRYPAGFLRGKVLYNLHRVVEDEWDSVVVCESQWGVLACVRAGIMNAVAIMSNNATEEQVAQLARFEKVTLCLDGDASGIEGTRNLLDALAKRGGMRLEFCALRSGEQPDHLAVDELRKRLGLRVVPLAPIAVATA